MLTDLNIQALPPQEWMGLHMYEVGLAWEALSEGPVTIAKLKDLCRAVRQSKYHWLCLVDRELRRHGAFRAEAIPGRRSADILRVAADQALKLLHSCSFPADQAEDAKFLRTSFSYHLADLDQCLGLETPGGVDRVAV